jgi:hypothetical protein
MKRMTRAEFIQRAVLAVSDRRSISDAVDLANALESSGKAPWDDTKENRQNREQMMFGGCPTCERYLDIIAELKTAELKRNRQA